MRHATAPSWRVIAGGRSLLRGRSGRPDWREGGGVGAAADASIGGGLRKQRTTAVALLLTRMCCVDVGRSSPIFFLGDVDCIVLPLVRRA